MFTTTCGLENVVELITHSFLFLTLENVCVWCQTMHIQPVFNSRSRCSWVLTETFPASSAAKLTVRLSPADGGQMRLWRGANYPAPHPDTVPGRPPYDITLTGMGVCVCVSRCVCVYTCWLSEGQVNRLGPTVQSCTLMLPSSATSS